jgi:hypothetical protein
MELGNRAQVRHTRCGTEKALALPGTWAGDGKCADPLVLHHISGGGMIVVLTERAEASLAMLRDGQIRRQPVADQESGTPGRSAVAGELLPQGLQGLVGGQSAG